MELVSTHLDWISSGRYMEEDEGGSADEAPLEGAVSRLAEGAQLGVDTAPDRQDWPEPVFT
jgi:hypothetical protein